MKVPAIPVGKWMMAFGATVVVGLASPDAALACRAEIGDFVWLDVNRNGIQDSGEPGIANVVVKLALPDGTVVDSKVTDANGYYLFTNGIDADAHPFCGQEYVVSVETPSGLQPGFVGVGSDASIDSNAHTGASVLPVDLPGPPNVATDLTIDFGFVQPPVCNASLGNFVFNDLNNNGIQDSGEPGIPGIVMTLSGTSSGSTTTNASGFYGFADLCQGSYTVCAEAPLGFDLSPAGVGDPALDSNGLQNGNNSCSTAVSLAVGESNQTIDFGFWQKPITGPGTGTPGYWKNHPEAWPVPTIQIGGVEYTKEQALYFMGLPDGDKTVTMFRSLVSAKLNVLIGNVSSCIDSTIAAADAWMAQNGPVGSNVRARTAAWRVGEPLYRELDAYNNGDRCAPHRD